GRKGAFSTRPVEKAGERQRAAWKGREFGAWGTVRRRRLRAVSRGRPAAKGEGDSRHQEEYEHQPLHLGPSLPMALRSKSHSPAGTSRSSKGRRRSMTSGRLVSPWSTSQLSHSSTPCARAHVST